MATRSKIQRIVRRELGTPSSTRELHNVSQHERDNMILTLKMGIAETLLCARLGDRQMLGYSALSRQLAGLPPLGDGQDIGGIRLAVARHGELLSSLLVRFEGSESGKITGMPGPEFAALIDALQASWREATFFAGLDSETAKAVYSKSKAVYHTHGFKDFDFGGLPEEDLPQFFQKRAKVIRGILKEINMPYRKD